MTARKLLFSLGLAFLALGLAACDTGRKAPPKTEVRVLNAVPGYTALNFRRVESTADTLEFKNGQIHIYDEDTYTFNVDTANVLTGAPQRLLSFPQKVADGTTYTIVIYDAGTGLDRVVLETPTVSPTATDVQVQALHIAKDVPQVDFYLTAPGADLLATSPLGTMAYLQQIATRRLAPADYEITVTAPGNPAAVLFKSSPFAMIAARSVSFTLTPDAESSNQPFSVVAFGDVANAFFNMNGPASLRIVNAAADQAPRDVAIDSQFSPPLFSAVPFTTETAYSNITAGSQVKVNVTPAGNPGTLEVDTSIAFSQSSRFTMIVGGNPGSLTYAVMLDDNRRYKQYATLRLYSGVTLYPSVTFYVVAPGTDVSTGVPLATVTAPAGTDQIKIPPGDYELILQDPVTSTTIAGPTPLTISAGGVYGVLATNDANGVSADITLLDEFQ